MNTTQLNKRPGVTAALQIAVLVAVFQGVVATSPSIPSNPELGSEFEIPSTSILLHQPAR